MAKPARHHTRTAALAAVLAAALVGGGCTVNPATGRRQLSLIGEQQEIAMGRDAAKDVAQSMGLYDDPELVAYVQQVGRGLAAGSERPDLPWSFQVVDDPVVNAFALPGGYIYVTRGILTHFNSEAEMAAVLGHEIGHVTARHSVEQISEAQLATLGLGVASITSEDFQRYAGLASQGLQILFLKFSRDDERQADSLGLRYMVREHYDPTQMVDVFDTLARVSRVQGGGRIPVWASTHPAPEQRAQTISQRIQNLPSAEREGRVERDAYLGHVDGVVFGEDPRQGYVIGSVFYHPELAFRLTFPAGWQIDNQRQAVSATSPDKDAVVVLTVAGEASPHAAAQGFFAQSGIEADGTGRNGLYYFHTTTAGQQSQTLRGVASFSAEGGHVYRLLGYTVDTRWSTVNDQLEHSLRSFAKLTEHRYLNVKPKRVQVVTLPGAMTIAEVARRYSATIDAEEMAIVNGVQAEETLDRGRLVKVVVGGELPTSQ